MKYRMLNAGEILQPSDEFRYTDQTVWLPIVQKAIGTAMLACNVGKYRRPISNAATCPTCGARLDQKIVES